MIYSKTYTTIKAWHLYTKITKISIAAKKIDYFFLSLHLV